MRQLSLAFIYLFLTLLYGCNRVGLSDVSYPYDLQAVNHTIDSLQNIEKGWMYADKFSAPLFSEHLTTTCWVNQDGIDDRADTLLAWLGKVEAEGLKRESFLVDEIEEDLRLLRKMKPDSCDEHEFNRVLGCLEYRLTTAYLRYAYGQRYGYTRPHAIFADSVFDLRCEVPTDSFLNVAMSRAKDVDDLSEFLSEIQPNSTLHTLLSREYANANAKNDTALVSLCRINLERSRWRYNRPDEYDRFIWVNIAEFMLTATDRNRGESLTMKVCCGRTDHQTPLLTSSISRLELNPYWVIPTNIIKNELAKMHVGDSAYYARNSIIAIDKQTKEEIDPTTLSANQLKSGRYTLRQEKGEGNSLGRLVFRFPNKYSVYLHDTNSPGAFKRTRRTVSHGCVRVEKPLELALFLMGDPSDLLIDKIRIAIDKEPLSAAGRKYMENTEPEKYMSSYYYKPPIPVFLDYYTLYPDTSNVLQRHSDPYGYDPLIKRVLDRF